MAVVAGAEAGLKAIEKGATILQLRAPLATARELEREADALVPRASVPVIISARCDLAVACGAAGVNLPERDIDVAGARLLVGQRLLGRSVHSVATAVEAEKDDADFVIFGPVWPSASHPDQRGAGVAALAEVVHAVRIPVLAIGGVTLDRVDALAGAGAAGYAAITQFQ